MAYSILLFDVDGTLCDPGESLIECARYALSKFDIHETNKDNLRRLIGPPLEHVFRDYYGFNKAQVDRAVSYFRDRMQREGVQLYSVYPGISELLKDLKQQGKRLAIVTSKIDHIAKDVLANMGLLDYFEFVSAQTPNVVVDKEVILSRALSELSVKDRSDVVMIGDRRHDVEAAKAMNLDSIGALWGYGDRQELESEGATHIVADTNELRELLLGKS